MPDLAKKNPTKESLRTIRVRNPYSMSDLFGSEDKVNETEVMHHHQKSNFEALMKQITREKASSKILMHTSSMEVNKIILKSRGSEPKFNTILKGVGASFDKTQRNQNLTNDEYNRNLLQKNPFNLIKHSNVVANKPRALHSKLENKLNIAKFASTLRVECYSKEMRM